MATTEFSKFAGILSAALPQHHLSGFEIAPLESIASTSFVHSDAFWGVAYWNENSLCVLKTSVDPLGLFSPFSWLVWGYRADLAVGCNAGVLAGAGGEWAQPSERVCHAVSSRARGAPTSGPRRQWRQGWRGQFESVRWGAPAGLTGKGSPELAAPGRKRQTPGKRAASCVGRGARSSSPGESRLPAEGRLGSSPGPLPVWPEGLCFLLPSALHTKLQWKPENAHAGTVPPNPVSRSAVWRRCHSLLLQLRHVLSRSHCCFLKVTHHFCARDVWIWSSLRGSRVAWALPPSSLWLLLWVWWLLPGSLANTPPFNSKLGNARRESTSLF